MYLAIGALIRESFTAKSLFAEHILHLEFHRPAFAYDAISDAFCFVAKLRPDCMSLLCFIS